MTLEFVVKNQTLTKHRNQESLKVVADSRNYLKAKFNFQTKEWRDQVCYALFTYQGQTYKMILGSEKNCEYNECFVPFEVIKQPGFIVSCYCGARITTNSVNVEVGPSGYTENIINQHPTPSLMEQEERLMKKYAIIANQILQDCVKIHEEITKKHKEED